MYILMIARGIPSEKHPQWGCFEKDQAEALAKLGHKVVVMSVDARFEPARGKLGLHIEEINGVTYYNRIIVPGVLTVKLFGQDFYLKHVRFPKVNRLFKQIVAKEGEPDLIYTQFFQNTAMGVMLKNKYHIPVVGIEHLSKFNEPILSKQDLKWSSFAFNGADTLIAVADTMAKNLENRFGKQFEVVHNMHGYEFGNETAFEKKKEEEPLVFVSAASLIRRKGYDVLIKAFARADIPKDLWKLNIIGWGVEKENLQQLIDSNKLSGNIRLLGKMGKMGIAEELRKSDVFVLPSRNENFSVAILEGLSEGLPVIATDCGGIRECITDENGIIVPVDDIDAMANALREMTKNYSRYNRGAIAEDCRLRFSPNAVAQKLTKVFEMTLRNNSK